MAWKGVLRGLNRIKLFFVHKMLERGRKKSRKKEPWLGKQFFVPRAEGKPVEVIMYKPEVKKYTPMPVMFNIHGGAWVGGDASALDEQSQKMADLLCAFVVNINYTKVDAEPFPYAQKEVADVVRFFWGNTAEYGIDRDRFNLIGYSAGGHICAGAAIMLKDEGIPLCSNIPVYPFLDFHVFNEGLFPGMDAKSTKLMEEVFFRDGVDRYSTVMSPAAASVEALKGLSATELILCGPDALYQQGFDYRDRLLEAGVPVELKVFEESTHGFMEGDYDKELNEMEQKQKEMCEACFQYLIMRMWILWGYAE